MESFALFFHSAPNAFEQVFLVDDRIVQDIVELLLLGTWLRSVG
jgi:hypothetical protein